MSKSQAEQVNKIPHLLYKRLAETNAGFAKNNTADEALSLLLAAINHPRGKSLAYRAEAAAACSGWLLANVVRTMVDQKRNEGVVSDDDHDNAIQAVINRTQFWLREYLILHAKGEKHVKKS